MRENNERIGEDQLIASLKCGMRIDHAPKDEHKRGKDKMPHEKVTRRDFLKSAVAGAAGLALCGPKAIAADKPKAGAKSIVAIARAANVLDENLQVNKQSAAAILRKAVAAAVETKTSQDAWKKLIKPTDIVGIVTSKAVNPTHMELADIIKEDLMALGVPEANIRLPQRDVEAVKECTALIALPGLKAHWLTGLGTVLKLYIMYSGKPSEYHNENSVKLGEIWNLDFIKGKTKLVIIDALRPLCDKGPQPDPRYMWNYGGIIASTDPVAAEAVGLKIIQAKRDEIKGEPWPLSPPPLCVEAADKQYGLGTCNFDRIRIVKSGPTEGMLV